MASKDLTVDKVVTQNHVRGFVQYGPPQPGNAPQFYGIANQYFFAQGIENPVRGSITPINWPTPQRYKDYSTVGQQIDPPDAGTYTLMLAMKHLAVPRAMVNVSCELTTILTVGRCKNPSDLNRGYDDFLYFLAQGLVSDNSQGDMMASDSDNPNFSTLTITTSDQYAAGPLYFGETAAAEINANVTDIAYGYPQNCQGCQDGNERIYALSQPVGSSPSFQAEVNYSVDAGATWNVSTITGLGVVAQPSAIDVVGEFLVVLVNSTNTYYYAELDVDTGAPGSWTAVTGGFVTAGKPNDMVVVSPTEVYIAADAGYIYKLETVGAPVAVLSAGSVTTQPLYRIHSDGTTIVAVGGVGAVVYSGNQGATWALAAVLPTNFSLRAISVRNEKLWFTASGVGEAKIYYTTNGGKSWTQITIAGTAPAQVNDIVFATAHIGYIAYDVAGPQGVIAYTVDGGNSWITGKQRQATTLPTFDRANRLAVPNGVSGVNANFLAVAGLAGDGSDGIILVGAANIV